MPESILTNETQTLQEKAVCWTWKTCRTLRVRHSTVGHYKIDGHIQYCWAITSASMPCQCLCFLAFDQ